MLEEVFLRTEFNYDRDVASDESGLSCPEKGRTKQEFKEECDINTIVRRFGVTGLVPQKVRAPMNADFVDVMDFKQAMNAMVAARESFDQMSSKVRARFHNDPAEFVDFCSDPKNKDEMIKFGLVPSPVEVKAPEPMLVRVVEPEKAS